MGVRLTPQDKAWILVVWAAVCLVAIFSMAVPRGYFLTSFGDLTQCLLLVSAFIACLTNVRLNERRARFFWLLMALGFGLWLSAQMLWTYFEVFLGREVPNPFVGDVILFLHLVPMMGALAVQPHIDRDQQVAPLGALDFVLLLVWWLYLYLFVVIPWQYVLPEASNYGRSFDVIYFLEHFVLLISASSLWLRSRGRWRVVYRHLVGAAFLYALSSVVASVAIDFGRYYTGSFYDVPLVASMAWFSGIGLLCRHLKLRTEPAQQVGDKPGTWVPSLAMLAALSLPVLAAWAVYGSHASSSVRAYRLVLTLAVIVVIGGLRSLNQYRLDRELARVNQELREACLTDMLTGTRNRRFLTTAIEADVQQAIRSYCATDADPGSRGNRDLIFYFIDIDHFKEVNDRYGHDPGDRLLVQIARRISSAIRHSDVLIRWGGEEFLVVSRYTSRDEATTLASRILHAVGSEQFQLDSHRVGCTCSIGWAVFPWFVSEPEAVHYEKVLQLADCALYRAKDAGRNQAIGLLPTTLVRPVSDAQSGWQPSQNVHEQFDSRTITTRGPTTTGQRDSTESIPTAEAVAASGKV